MDIRVSIIVPVYNTKQYLSRCIDSILSQSFTDFELLLIDDGSTDGSGIICDVYAEKDSRIRVFHKENGGVSSARNLGLKEAQGEWICFVDSDDELLPNGLQIMSDGISNEVDMIMAGYYEFEGETLLMDTSKYGKDGIISRNDALLMIYPSSSLVYMGYSVAKLYRKNLVLRKKLSFDEHIKIKEDTLFVVEYLGGIQNEVCYISTPVYKYVKSPVGAMGGLSQSYNRNYLTSFDAVVKMNRHVQGLPEIDKVLSMAAKYEVVNRIYLVLSHMIQHSVVDEKVMNDLKKKAVEEVGIGYYLIYQYERNKRRIRNYLKKKLNIKKNVQ